MYQPKHTIILVLMLLASGLTAKAQSTAKRPFEGSTHTYTVNGITVGAGYNFYITANTDGSGLYDDGLTGEFDILTSTTGVIGTNGLATTDIRWNTGAALHVYQLWLEATIPGGCSNNIRLEITPQPNMFDLLSENVPVTNTRSCPATGVSDGFLASSTSYQAGFTTLEFKVTRLNGTSTNHNWSFVPQLSVNPDLALGKVIISIVGSTSGTIAPVAGRYTVNGTDNEVLVTVSIENAPGHTRNVAFKVTEQREANTNLLDSDPTNDEVTHTIEVMPLIDSMGGV